MPQQLSREERELIAQRRLVKNLDTLGVANMRTLEMKIADAGPNHLRINPHIITQVRKAMVKAKRIGMIDGLWYHRTTENPERIEARLAVLKPLHARTNQHNFKLRMGQTFEIAILRCLENAGMQFVGGFTDLEDHDDSTLYSKEEPPLRYSGRRMPGEKRFDFLAFHPTAGPIGIEAKNVREWMYPQQIEIIELLQKALAADTLPILIARRIPYVTFRLMRACGVMVFENFNQLYPSADAELAALVRHKDNLGYHDIRIGNEPNPHLVAFITNTVPANADEYRARFDSHKDLLSAFSSKEMQYPEFAARVRRREQGVNEDIDPQDDPYGNPDDYERNA